MEKKRIFVVDDEMHIGELIQYNLQKDGYDVTVFERGEDLLHYLKENVPHLILLDLMLPGMDGLEVCRQLRSMDAFKKTPIIMLTAKGEEVDKILGLEMGADDYITKPFSIRELNARIKAVLRRTGYESDVQNEVEILQVRDITIDLNKREVYKGEKILQMTLKEFELLNILAKNKGHVLSRDILLDKVWGYDYYGETRTVDVHIRHLRKLIEDEKETYIETVRGIGYKLKE
ncbi:MAG: response regulator transcription factor [Firmicutes bacterium]|nr:response regulator transcription factor [Bacillota bacterium]